MTPAQEKLAAAAREAVDSGRWERLGGGIRWAQELPTPENIPARWWGAETYKRRVFLNLAGGRPLIGIDRCPWTERLDTSVSFKRAHEILADPESVFA